MSTQAHNASLSDLLPDTIIELYEVSIEEGGVKRFHAGKIVNKDIVLTDPDTNTAHTYFSLPIEADGFESKGDGTLSRPRLLIANPDGVISDLIKRRDDMVGQKFKRIRIFLKYIDEVNFPEETNPFAVSDSSARFDEDIFIFNRKVSESKFFIEFELISPLEMEGHTLPARLMVANSRDFFRRKSDTATVEANLGIPVADANNKRFDQASSGYGITSMRWSYDYIRGQVEITTGALASDGASSLTVAAISNEITPNRTIVFSTGTFEVTALAEKNATSLTGKLRLNFEESTLPSSSTGTVGYVKGDVVRIKSGTFSTIDKVKHVKSADSSADEPDAFFVCIKDHTVPQDPRYKKEYWGADQCSKTVSACTLRFKSYSELPFGGFPSIEAYRYTN
jgi:lambda family phage minor tail protein L